MTTKVLVRVAIAAVVLMSLTMVLHRTNVSFRNETVNTWQGTDGEFTYAYASAVTPIQSLKIGDTLTYSANLNQLATPNGNTFRVEPRITTTQDSGATFQWTLQQIRCLGVYGWFTKYRLEVTVPIRDFPKILGLPYGRATFEKGAVTSTEYL